MDGWMHGWRDGWLVGRWTDGEMIAQKDGWLGACVAGWMAGCMNTNLLTIKITSLSSRIAAQLVSSSMIFLRPSRTAPADGTLSYRYPP